MTHVYRIIYSFCAVAILCFQAINIHAQNAIEVIPFRLIDDIMYIQVDVNNQKGFNFMFDTGSSTTVIGNSTANKLRLGNGTEGRSMGAAGAYDTEIYFQNQIHIGELLIDDVSLLKTVDNLESTVFGEELDGIIGYDIFSKYVVEIDYDNSLISLYNFDDYQYKDDGLSLAFKSFSNIPYLPITIHLNSKSYTGNYLLDTGAQLEILFTSSFIQKEKIISELEHDYRLFKNIGIDDNTIELIIGKIDGAMVFGHLFKQVPIVTSEVNQAVFALDAFDGIVGNGILKRFKTTYDYSRNNLYIEEGQLIQNPFTVDCLGASFERSFEEKRLIIESIIPNSPADKSGLQPGDEILEMNGIKTNVISNDQLRSFTEADGKKLKLQIKRGDENQTLSIRLKSLI